MIVRWTLAVCILLTIRGAGLTAEFYVAPDGKDTNPGTRAAPFGTLEAARDAIRKRRTDPRQPGGGATVWLRGGVYRITKTFELDERDSGTKDAPIVYRTYKGEEVRLSGGCELEPTAFKKVTDPAVLARLPEASRGKVLQVDLKAQGITDFGRMRRRGFGHPYANAGLELFFNDQPMQLARWPNKGTADIGKVLDPGSEPRTGDFSNRGGKFTYDFDRPTRWKQAEDIWLSGIFCWPFADDTIQVRSIDTEKKTITLADTHVYGIKSGPIWGIKRAYYALNLLEEIDEPGEWYLDRRSGILYFCPPGPVEEAKISVSLLEEPMVAMEGASHITFQGLTFEVARGIAVTIERGTENVVAGCTFRNLGVMAVCIGQGAKPDPRPCGGWAWAIAAENGKAVPAEPISRQLGDCLHAIYADSTWNRKAGTRHGVVGCDIYNTGAGGVSLGGGDRKTLTPAGNYVLNCNIHHFNRLDRAYRAGVNIDGVGNRIAHCLIHDATGSAINLFGNDHVMEYNEVHHAILWAGDMGAFYMCRDSSQRGNVLRYNFFHHNGKDSTIYLDDYTCGVTIFGNLFYKTPWVVRLNMGHDNIVRNNIVIASGSISPGAANNRQWTGHMKDPLQVLRHRKTIDVTQPPYVTRYPKLADTFDPSPDLRRSNQICGNVLVQSGPIRVSSGDEVKDNLVMGDNPGFVDAAVMDFRLKPDSVVFTKIPSFQVIPFEKIGLYKDEYRRAVVSRAVEDNPGMWPTVRDPKTRQFAAPLDNLNSVMGLPEQRGWRSFAGRAPVAVAHRVKAGEQETVVAAEGAGDSWATIWHGVILDADRDIVLEMDACLPDPSDGKSYFELYLKRGQDGRNSSFGVALVGGAQGTGRGDTVGARRDSAGPRVLAKDHLTPGHWYRLQLLIPAGACQGRLLAQDLTAGEKEPRALGFADGSYEADLCSGDKWVPVLGDLDVLVLRLGGEARAANILLKN